MNQKNETLSEAHSPEATLIIYLYEVFAVRDKEKFCLNLEEVSLFLPEQEDQAVIDR